MFVTDTMLRRELDALDRERESILREMEALDREQERLLRDMVAVLRMALAAVAHVVGRTRSEE
jgi:hypothetical protein